MISFEDRLNEILRKGKENAKSLYNQGFEPVEEGEEYGKTQGVKGQETEEEKN